MQKYVSDPAAQEFSVSREESSTVARITDAHNKFLLERATKHKNKYKSKLRHTLTFLEKCEEQVQSLNEEVTQLK